MNRYRSEYAVWLASILGAMVLSGLLVLLGINASQVNAEAGYEWTRLATNGVLLRPRPFLHRTVTVAGEIADIWDQRTLLLDSSPLRHGLLVVLSNKALQGAPPLHKGQAVKVVGRLRFLTRREAQALASGLTTNARLRHLPAIHAHLPCLLATEVKAEASHSSGGQQ